MREGQGTVVFEGDGGIVDEQVEASIGLLQEAAQLLDGLLVVNVQLVELDLHAILTNQFITVLNALNQPLK